MEDNSLTVSDVIVQRSERNLFGRSVRLDALCTLGNGTLCNIEVQRSNNDDHLRRARYNASAITSRETDVGTRFESIPEVYIIYISEFDFFKKGKTIYHIEKSLKKQEIMLMMDFTRYLLIPRYMTEQKFPTL